MTLLKSTRFKCTIIRSAFRFVLPLALLLGTTAITTSVLPTAAHADWEEQGSWTGADGTTFTVWQNDGGSYAVVIEKGSTVSVSLSDDVAWFVLNKPGFKWSDPGPDDTSSTAGEKPDPIEMLKDAKGLNIQVRVLPDQTPLAQCLDTGGAGFVPHWNPGDDDNGRGPPGAPKSGDDTGPTAKQLASRAALVNLAVAELNGIAGAMGDVEGLGSENAPGLPQGKTSGNNGNNGNNGSGDDSGKNNGIKKVFGSDLSLGPRPDLVNPPHSSVMSPGLLDGGNNALTGNGPAGSGPASGAPARGVGAGIR